MRQVHWERGMPTHRGWCKGAQSRGEAEQWRVLGLGHKGLYIVLIHKRCVEDDEEVCTWLRARHVQLGPGPGFTLGTLLGTLKAKARAMDITQLLR